MTELILIDPIALKFASKDLKNDKKVIKEALKMDYFILEFASDELKNNFKFMLEVVKNKGWSL